MKIVSWNVNGVRAAWGHGLAAFLGEYDADIFAFQETKLSEPFLLAEKEDYETYWNFCSERSGYSGTAVMTRIKPLAITYGIGNPTVKTEGRIITLEFDHFYLITCYFPNALRSYLRKDYRAEWDEAFIQYIEELKHNNKPVIICGDFNVVAKEEEMDSDDSIEEEFQTEEQTNLTRIISCGFVDAYRHLHPGKTGKYTWWSRKRDRNRGGKGRRLDYFFVSNDMTDCIVKSGMLTNVSGSDHCPVYLEIAIRDTNEIRYVPQWKNRYTYKDLLELEEKRVPLNGIRFSNLEALWKSIDWKQAETHLSDMQEALAKSARTGLSYLITKWQKKIVYSIDAKLLAVRSVCNNAVSAGVDGVKWRTPYEKMSAALSLTSKDYKAIPARLLLIKCKNGKQRRIRIETFYDRAIQTLYSYALDPIAESLGDRNSYAYRKGRSSYDINARIINIFSGADAPEWVLLADVKACYDSMCHDWIMKHIPLPHVILREFLKSGFVFGGQRYLTDAGIGLGEPLSPIVANMVLDGLQQYVYSRLYPTGEIDFKNGYLLRYADDIVIASRTGETAYRIKGYVQEFLHERGLELSEEKTLITHTSQGFTFMKREYWKEGCRLFAKPSRKAVEIFMGNIKETIENYTGSQKSLIDKVNKMIDGWVTYHKVTDSREAFTEIDTYISGLLLDLCRKKHPKWSMGKIFEKYWYLDHDGRRYYSLPNKREVRIKQLSDTLFYRYTPVKPGVNPYIDKEYLEQRRSKRQIESMTGIYRSIWMHQNGKCYYCGRSILVDEEKELVDIGTGHFPIERHRAYVHKRCAYGSLEYIDTDVMPVTLNDLRDLLTRLSSEKDIDTNARRYYLFSEYFRTCDKNTVTLTFKQIEDIMCDTLGISALREEFWYRTGFSCISQCWLNNGYEIKNLYLEGKRRVVFRLAIDSKNTSSVVLPAVLKYQRIPLAAKYELENYFKFIINKYDL